LPEVSETAPLLAAPASQDGFHFTARFNDPYTPLIEGGYDMPSVVRVD
jgi:hypothetical protein